MGYRELFRPTKLKVGLFALLIVVSIYAVATGFETLARLTGHEPGCGLPFVNHGDGSSSTEFAPNLLTYVFAPFTALLYNPICNILVHLLNLPYLYMMAAFAVEVLRKRKNITNKSLRTPDS